MADYRVIVRYKRMREDGPQPAEFERMAWLETDSHAHALAIVRGHYVFQPPSGYQCVGIESRAQDGSVACGQM